MSRRSPFQSSQFGKSLGKPAQQEQPVPAPQAEGAFSGDTHLQGVPTTQKKSRDRGWEKENKTQSYWGIPIELREVVGNIAADLRVKVDDVVRVFFEFSLDEYHQGQLALDPVTNPYGRGKMTLYPKASGWGQKAGWKRETWDPKPRQIKGNKKVKVTQKDEKQVDTDTCVLTVRRMPVELHKNLCGVAEQKVIPVGQVAIAFLQRGLQAYLSGELVPSPSPIIQANTLYPENS